MARARGTIVARPRIAFAASTPSEVSPWRCSRLVRTPPSIGGRTIIRFVLRLGYGARHILFTGDAEHAEEGDLLRLAPGTLRADVLKVGHHGAAQSTSLAFLAAVFRPEWAIISVRRAQRFGHPARRDLGRLARGPRSHLIRTDIDGGRFRRDGRALASNG